VFRSILIEPTSGRASVLGPPRGLTPASTCPWPDTRDNSPEIRRRVGFLPGDYALYPQLTGAKVLDYLAELRGGVDRRVRERSAERLILDEPIAGLDPLGLPVVTEPERTLRRSAELSAGRWQTAAWASHLA
jgi:ABC-type multidrug transport system ATPase subunit